MRTAILILATTLGFSVGAHGETATESFEKLKSIAGQWETMGENGQTVTTKYEVISDGSAVLESHMGMVSVYHLDGDSILMTHYCSAHNQPRLRASRLEGNLLDFAFVDVTGDLSHGYISHVQFNFISADQIEEQWSHSDDKGMQTVKFVLNRKH